MVPFTHTVDRRTRRGKRPRIPICSISRLLTRTRSINVKNVVSYNYRLPRLVATIRVTLSRPNGIRTTLTVRPGRSILRKRHNIPKPSNLPLGCGPCRSASFRSTLTRMRHLTAACPRRIITVNRANVSLFHANRNTGRLRHRTFHTRVTLTGRLNLPVRVRSHSSRHRIVRALLTSNTPRHAMFRSCSNSHRVTRVTHRRN